MGSVPVFPLPYLLRCLSCTDYYIIPSTAFTVSRKFWWLLLRYLRAGELGTPFVVLSCSFVNPLFRLKELDFVLKYAWLV